jgi:glutaredoxin 3
MTAAIEIYTRPGCGYCTAAKSLLTRKKAAFTEFDVATDPRCASRCGIAPARARPFRRSSSARTHVGGCDELYALDREGKLDSLLAGEKAGS